MSTLHLKTVAVEGFRGINEKIEFNIDKSPLIIHGPNGAGKTSILQAIEWGLFGWLPHVAGGEFEEEDAIVNQFHPINTAKVELLLENSKENFRITREREQSRWSRPKSSVMLELNDEVYKGKEAETKIRDLIGLTEDEFYAAVYLHQEALTDFITGDTNTRNAILDKLLGTYSLREIIEVFPINKLNRILNELQQGIQTLQAGELSRLPVARNQLGNYKKELLKKGILEEELQAEEMVASIAKLNQQIEEIAEKLDIQIAYSESPFSDFVNIQKSLSNIRQNLNKIEEKRFQTYEKLVERLASLKSSREKLSDLKKKVDELGEFDQSVSDERLKTMNKEVEQNQNRQIELRKEMDFIHNKSLDYIRFSNDLDKLSSEKNNVSSDFESIEAITAELNMLHRKVVKLKDGIENMESYNQLLINAAKYLEKTNPNRCPICKSSINASDLAKTLQIEVTKSEKGNQTLTLMKDLEDAKEAIENLQKVKMNFEDLKERIKKVKADYEACEKEIMAQTNLKTVNLDIINKYEHELKSENEELASSLDKMRREKVSLENEISRRTQLVESLKETVSQIRKKLEITDEVDLLSVLSEELADAEKRKLAFSQLNVDLKNANRDIERLEEIRTYLSLEIEVLNLEESLPELEKMLQLETKKFERLSKLRDGLDTIRQAVLEEQRSFISYMLSKIESKIDSTYKQLVKHPYYSSIELVCETQRNKNIYWIKGKGVDFETHVRTRFSKTQMNATAIAIFNSVSEELSKNLNLVIFDDPFQSMDQPHQDALIVKLAKDATKRQVIIATHDDEIMERLPKSLGDSQILEVLEWSSKGPNVT